MNPAPADSSLQPVRLHPQPPSVSEYFFEIENQQLTFKLKLNLSTSKALRSFLDILDVTNLKKSEPQVIINYKLGQIHIIFPHTQEPNQQFIYSLIEFIEKLNEHNMLEKHENPKALWFYSHNNGDEILKFKNYPRTLQDHLELEKKAFSSIITRTKGLYTVLVEVGCGAELENIEISKKTSLKYLGIEFSPTAAQAAQQTILAQNLSAVVKCLNILKIRPDRLPLTEYDRPILIFPFNLLGNIAPISLLFSKLRAFSYDFIVSIYRLDNGTETMRRAYYTKCGYKDIQVQTDEKGNVTFSSADGLYSVAYSAPYLTALLSELGFEVMNAPCSKHGSMIYAKAKPWACVKDDMMENDHKTENPPLLTQFSHSRRPSVPEVTPLPTDTLQPRRLSYSGVAHS